MPSFVGPIVNNQIIFACHITKSLASGEKVENFGQLQKLAFRGLFDTGAQRSMITENVVNSVGLVPFGMENIRGVGGKYSSHQFLVDVHISVANPVMDKDGNHEVNVFATRSPNIEACLLPDAKYSFDVLLGMDVIQQCHFSMFREHFILSI